MMLYVTSYLIEVEVEAKVEVIELEVCERLVKGCKNVRYKSSQDDAFHVMSE